MENETTSNSTIPYKTIACTVKYELAIIHGQNRIFDLKTKHILNYCDIPEQLAKELNDYLTIWKEYGLSKRQGIAEFNKDCKNIMQNEWDEFNKNCD